VERLSGELKEVKDKHLRLYSEFENFRRRNAKERLELIGSANADLMIALLPILDDFERAREAAEKSNSSTEFEGMNLIYQKLLKELNNKGLKPMENLEGESFDAEVHEAISQTPAPKKKLKNRIIHVVEKGYYLNDKVIRYAKVVIGT
jgi:molecular chaperone GrpE